MGLSKYQHKRKFQNTPEPKGNIHSKDKTLRFVVQEHHASRLHYDFRLELGGVLKSWAIPKGPSMDPTIKHLAVMVEDHPFAYRTFHGTIPQGNYGAGTVKIWDEGTYTPVEKNKNNEKILKAGLKNGDLKFILNGKKLRGEFALVKLKKRSSEEKEANNWLLIKKNESIAAKESNQILAGKKTSMPQIISPMLAKLATAPFDDSNWIYELKWDGYRAITHIKKEKITLSSRNNQNFTPKYQEIVSALQSIHADAVLDGEIVAVDKKGTPRFQLLQEYSKNQKDVTLIYYLFDLLYLNGHDLRQLPLIQRKLLLKKLIPDNIHLKYSDHIDTYGTKLFDLAKKKNIEGIMAKRKDSQYLATRSNDWQKIKNIQMQEAIICGFTKPNGHRKEFGALILGIYEDKELRYIGHTGSGFDEKKLQEIIMLLKPLITEKCPFSITPKTNEPATWVKPQKICQIKFSEWTSDGIMRQPIFLGLRDDKKPQDISLEITADHVSHNTSQFSNTEKIFWTKERYTKGDVISYYDHIAPFILPYLKDRPESLNRHPDGIAGISFYQKDVLNHPSWVKTTAIYSKADDKDIHWLICNDKQTLLYMANLGCIEINPWNSRISKKDYPDYLIIDLDPEGVNFQEVVTTALTAKKIMDKVKIDSFVKTSGKTGLHILVPLGARYTYEQTKQFAEILATTIFQTLRIRPVFYAIHKKEKRKSISTFSKTDSDRQSLQRTHSDRFQAPKFLHHYIGMN
jgi:bifunctional non-homologous end joining protein LigD